MQANYVASDKQIAEQAEYFRNHHQGKGSLMADWTAAWRSWWDNRLSPDTQARKRCGIEARGPGDQDRCCTKGTAGKGAGAGDG